MFICGIDYSKNRTRFKNRYQHGYPCARCNINTQKSGDGDDQNSGDLGDDTHAEQIKTINIKYSQTIIRLAVNS